jgi:hypothetical protein
VGADVAGAAGAERPHAASSPSAESVMIPNINRTEKAPEIFIEVHPFWEMMVNLSENLPAIILCHACILNFGQVINLIIVWQGMDGK